MIDYKKRYNELSTLVIIIVILYIIFRGLMAHKIKIMKSEIQEKNDKIWQLEVEVEGYKEAIDILRNEGE